MYTEKMNRKVVQLMIKDKYLCKVKYFFATRGVLKKEKNLGNNIIIIQLFSSFN